METKKKYIAPAIEIIFLDNEISLALESAPPIGPDEVNLDVNQQHINPFHTNLGWLIKLNGSKRTGIMKIDTRFFV